MRVFACHGPQHPKSRSYSITATFDSQLDNVLPIEVIRILRKACAAGVLNALVHRQDGKVTRATQPSVAKHPLEIREHAQVPIRSRIDTVDEIRPWKIQALFGDFRRLEPE